MKRVARERCIKVLADDEVPGAHRPPSSKRAAASKNVQHPLSESDYAFASRTRMRTKKRKDFQGRKHPERVRQEREAAWAAELAASFAETGLFDDMPQWYLDNVAGRNPHRLSEAEELRRLEAETPRPPRAKQPASEYTPVVTRAGVVVPQPDKDGLAEDGDGTHAAVAPNVGYFTCSDCCRRYKNWDEHQEVCTAPGDFLFTCCNPVCPSQGTQVWLFKHQCYRNAEVDAQHRKSLRHYADRRETGEFDLHVYPPYHYASTQGKRNSNYVSEKSCFQDNAPTIEAT